MPRLAKELSKQWLFVDESGKPEVYSANGINLVEQNQASKFLVLAAVRSGNQLKLQQQVMEFRLSLLKDLALVKIFSSAYTLDSFWGVPHILRTYSKSNG